MTAFPVAATAEAALHAPLGRAAREREARALAGGEVAFVTEWVGPAFASRAEAEAAVAGCAEPGVCTVRPVAAEGARPAPPVRPALSDGARWPKAAAAPSARWRLAVSFWRLACADEPPQGLEFEAARRLRRDPEAAAGLDGRALRRLTAQPLRPVRAQQPLDIGLFEVRLPERPDAVIPDE